MKPDVKAFFDKPTYTISYVVSDPKTRVCAVVDSVLDFDQAAGRTATDSADAIIAHIRAHNLQLDWILETHVHADHLSAAPYIRDQLGGQIAIGCNVAIVQNVFGDLFNAEPGFSRDGSQFDYLLEDEEIFALGELEVQALHTPGHTPACMTYVVGDCAFVGDTLFMPDYGTARTDFPGGDAATLYCSIQRLFALPEETRLFMCHDYKAPGRKEFAWETTVAEQKAGNVHVHDGTNEAEFASFRNKRDATLGMPQLILPSVQVNMRAGHLPPAENNGTRYLKLPIDLL
ncbi:MAG: MBL fold metallo-hydrolase [Pseudomonadales bacterium]